MRTLLRFALLGLIITSQTVSNAQNENYRIVIQQLEWAPDGNSIFFTAIKVKPDWSDFSSDKWTLFQYNLETKDLQKLEFGSLYFSYFNGRLAYDKTVEKNREILQLDLSSGEKAFLVQSPAKEGGPSWSPDGMSLAFYSDRDGTDEIYVKNISEGTTQRLTESGEYKCYNPVWSPSGDMIVYYFEKGDNKDQIYLTDSKGSYHENLTNDDHHNIYPSWTPNNRIIYIRDKGEVMIMDSDGTNKEKLLSESGRQVRMDWSGKKLLTLTASKDLVVLDLETKKMTVLLMASNIFK